ncbi:MAG: 2-oxoglutarate/2-oxoacid ferredoxin oxidoreductase subunit beta [Pyrinomonadaceae bacterium]|nr:2-oxoglutarate/2-oxoacid ferredoxin oxidoreductase subunit beta [Pyrinomonadaceae bacterium]
MSTNGNGNYNDGDAAEKIAADVENIGGNVSGSGSSQTYPGSVVAGEVAPPPAQLKKADFVSGQEVRWCPGCGDYSILNNVQKVMPELGIPREKIVFVSGIGCSSRFPYYMNTYGFHSIHGRAPAVATGIKAANPELSVWVVTGDGDALSIGGNHFMHAIRRNLDMNVILFNNRIYGLTKGQYSPTSELGKRTKSTPMGVIDYPLNPLSVAIASEATFVARSLDLDVKHLGATVQAAARHKGVSFIEVYQNCNIFNDGAFEYFTERSVRTDHMIYLEHGQPMIFGKERNKGIRMNGAHPEVVTIGENGITVDDLLVHDIHLKDPSVAFMLARMEYPDFPQPVGIFRAVERDTYEDMMEAQIEAAIAKQGAGSLEKLINSGDTWIVGG